MENIKDTGGASQSKSIKFRLAVTGITIEITGYQSEELETVTKVLSSRILWFFLVIVGAFIFSKVPELLNSLIKLWHGSP